MSKILFFAGLQERLGAEALELQWKGKTIAELRQTLKHEYSLETIDAAMVAINEEFASDTAVVQEDDTVAFIPPVSGG
ncbi:molybdopterin converting factor subunit 1 [Thalassobacillus sp. CUG 92003]|uniref:molybdopterin converting factor subunit 1 n=1 Tax=Thalassobacillus sp. CUG 92003 TaxID=2736641 RepID=UPI0015E70994|nr:molybdopterin converting factor subunit 1 [Thalassobacillus sp. CUG 92003]